MGKADHDTTFQELKDLVARFCEERNWSRHHSPKNLSMSIAIEAAELMEHYQWERDGKVNKKEVANELADVIFNCLNFANHEDIDIANSFKSKFKELEKKYPVEIFNAENDNLEEYQRIKKAYRQRRA